MRTTGTSSTLEQTRHACRIGRRPAIGTRPATDDTPATGSRPWIAVVAGTLAASLAVLAGSLAAHAASNLEARAWVALEAQASTDLEVLLAHVGDRIEEYYARAQNLICVERVTALPIERDLRPAGFGRVLEYELRVESDAASDGDRPTEAQVVRNLRKVNGRAPKPQEKPGCYDPNPLSPEPLAFLLPSHRAEYQFALAGMGKGKDRNAMLVDFRPLESGKPEILDDAEGRPGCFNVSLPGATSGRIWIDVTTHDVLRVEEHLKRAVDIPVPFEQQRKHGLPASLVIDRYDWAIRYTPVAFVDPVEQLVLPESIEVLAILHGAQSHRKRQVFSNYQRFMTNARLVKNE